MVFKQFIHDHDHDHDREHGRGHARRHGHGGRRWGRMAAELGMAAAGFAAEGRRRRGDAKFDILAALAEQPRHGYDVIKAIGEKRGVPPSAGSVYPTLQLLEDGGFVTSATVDGRRVYTIADEGRALLAERPADGEEAGEASPHGEGVRQSLIRLVKATVQAGRGADPATQARVIEILDTARRNIYTLLAEE